mmetsp:Transcript_26920/g.82634  ORF Transcript_26920/g.82634 Transcript_26920/m.82634 type:complete len:327 (+) Transcript_26920:261-1241(+)
MKRSTVKFATAFFLSSSEANHLLMAVSMASVFSTRDANNAAAFKSFCEYVKDGPSWWEESLTRAVTSAVAGGSLSQKLELPRYLRAKISLLLSSTLIFPRVSVPVLSEQRMSMPASSSMAERRCTMARCLESSKAPTARPVVTTTGNATGRTATRMTTANLKESAKERSSRMRRTKKRIKQTKDAMRAMPRAKLARSRFKLPPWSVTPAIKDMAWPIVEDAPVRETTMSSSPERTMLPASARSPGLLVSGNGSPVRAATSSFSGSPVPTKTPSAGTAAPMTRPTTSPGTNSAMGMRPHFPFLLQFASGAAMRFSSRMALPEFLSPT